jgi:hypothetical protein
LVTPPSWCISHGARVSKREPTARVSLYLFPWEYYLADGARLQWLLAQRAVVA